MGTNFLFGESGSNANSSYNKNNQNAKGQKKNEFNFSKYMNELKENSKIFGENYVKSLKIQNFTTNYNNSNNYKDNNNNDYYNNEASYNGNYSSGKFSKKKKEKYDY